MTGFLTLVMPPEVAMQHLLGGLRHHSSVTFSGPVAMGRRGPHVAMICTSKDYISRWTFQFHLPVTGASVAPKILSLIRLRVGANLLGFNGSVLSIVSDVSVENKTSVVTSSISC